jgi:hypothetical protein
MNEQPAPKGELRIHFISFKLSMCTGLLDSTKWMSNQPIGRAQIHLFSFSFPPYYRKGTLFGLVVLHWHEALVLVSTISRFGRAPPCALDFSVVLAY